VGGQHNNTNTQRVLIKRRVKQRLVRRTWRMNGLQNNTKGPNHTACEARINTEYIQITRCAKQGLLRNTWTCEHTSSYEKRPMDCNNRFKTPREICSLRRCVLRDLAQPLQRLSILSMTTVSPHVTSPMGMVSSWSACVPLACKHVDISMWTSY